MNERHEKNVYNKCWLFKVELLNLAAISENPITRKHGTITNNTKLKWKINWLNSCEWMWRRKVWNKIIFFPSEEEEPLFELFNFVSTNIRFGSDRKKSSLFSQLTFPLKTKLSCRIKFDDRYISLMWFKFFFL